MEEEKKPKMKKRLKRLMLIIVVVALCLVLSSSSTYVIMKWIVERVTGAAKKYTNDVTINDDGTVATGITAQELWDNMIEQGYEVDKYLDNADELATLMNAELVTQLPDTRANVTDPIDWDSIITGNGLDSADWQGDEPEYVELMRKKVKWYEKHHPGYIKNNYVCLIDVDRCRLTILEKKGSNWKLIAAWNTIQGVKNNKWAGTAYAWNGPRSRSYKGVFHVVGKIGTSATCYIGTDNHGTSEDNCQRFETTGYGNPDKLSLEKRFESHGCCNLSAKHAKWIYNNIPVGTTVIAFDNLNPMPNTEIDGNETAPSSSKMALTPSEWNKIAAEMKSEENELTEEENSKINEATGDSGNTSVGDDRTRKWSN